jgi:hypothetical protein
VVIFHSKTKTGFMPGEKWQVIENQGEGQIKVQRAGITKSFDPRSKGDWKVYETAEMALSVGDQVRVTEKVVHNKVAFYNNEIRKIAGIDDQHVTLDDGRAMPRDFVHLDQGVCLTSYSTQCSTVRQIVSLVPLSACTALDSKGFYVLASRATHRALFFTDCKDALREAALKEGNRPACWDYEKKQVQKPVSMDLQPGKRLTRAPKILNRLQRFMASGMWKTNKQPARAMGIER